MFHWFGYYYTKEEARQALNYYKKKFPDYKVKKEMIKVVQQGYKAILVFKD